MARFAFVLADQYEDTEFRRPWEEVRKAGHERRIVGHSARQEVAGKRGQDRATVEVTPADVSPGEFEALVIPGGYSPDKLRLDADVVGFVKGFFDAGKPVAAICHAPSLLVEADVLRGRTLTSWPSVRKDVENAGGRWVDEEVVRDGNLITSRKPDDLDAFCAALLESVAQVPGGGG
jgi:protease I